MIDNFETCIFFIFRCEVSFEVPITYLFYDPPHSSWHTATPLQNLRFSATGRKV